MSIPTIWLQAEHLGSHVHVKISTGSQGGQDDRPTYEKRAGKWNNAGLAGTLIMREHDWPLFIKSLAIGGTDTGLRVIWRLTPDDNRFLWNGQIGEPCIVGTDEPVPWEKPA